MFSTEVVHLQITPLKLRFVLVIGSRQKSQRLMTLESILTSMFQNLESLIQMLKEIMNMILIRTKVITIIFKGQLIMLQKEILSVLVLENIMKM